MSVSRDSDSDSDLAEGEASANTKNRTFGFAKEASGSVLSVSILTPMQPIARPHCRPGKSAKLG